MVALARQPGPNTPAPELMSSLARIGPFTITSGATASVVPETPSRQKRSSHIASTAATTTGRYSGRQPAITALTATFWTVARPNRGGTSAITSSDGRPTAAIAAITRPAVGGTTGSPSVTPRANRASMGSTSGPAMPGRPPGLALNCQEIVHPGRLCDGGGCRPTIPAEEEARMNIHKNARTTPRSRGQIVARVLTQQEAPAAVAAAVGVSERTVRKWVTRYVAEAEAGLADRTCRPRRSPGATPPLLVGWVERLRRQRWTGGEIAQALQLSASTVARLLRRQGLARLRALEPPVPIQRYQWARPGALLHLDVKKLGRIGRVGHRISGDRRRRVRGIGWEYVHVAIDDASRLAYVEVLRDEGGVTTTQFLWRARAWFRRHGVRVRRVLTDNGSGYVSARFARLCHSAGMRHLRTRPYTPRTNGKAERFIQTLLREWAYRRAYPSSRHRTEALPAWLYYYNWERGHGALHGRPPMSRLVAPDELMAVHT
jgi:transposase InsO family protein